MISENIHAKVQSIDSEYFSLSNLQVDCTDYNNDEEDEPAGE